MAVRPVPAKLERNSVWPMKCGSPLRMIASLLTGAVTRAASSPLRQRLAPSRRKAKAACAAKGEPGSSLAGSGSGRGSQIRNWAEIAGVRRKGQVTSQGAIERLQPREIADQQVILPGLACFRNQRLERDLWTDARDVAERNANPASHKEPQRTGDCGLGNPGKDWTKDLALSRSIHLSCKRLVS